MKAEEILKKQEVENSNKSQMEFWSIVIYNNDDYPMSIGIFDDEKLYNQELDALKWLKGDGYYKFQKGFPDDVVGWFSFDNSLM